jgi:UTP--glucose-1-phosphate uridylyltransferase
MRKQPTKAVIAAAGLGTRFLPQTKAMPKEMLPIIDKPVIQIIVEQLVASGVTDIIIVTGSTKRAIEDHFDRSDELEQELREKGKNELAEEIKKIAELANFVYIRQKGYPKGNARPLINASHLLSDDEPFFMYFADDFFRSEVPHAKQMLDVYNKTGKSVVSLIEVDPRDSTKYGMVKISDQVEDKVFNVDEIIEKPGPEKTPSNFAVTGGYLLTPEIMPIVREEKIGHSGEIGISESVSDLAKNGGVVGKFIDGIYHDAGDKTSYLKAVIDHALADPKLGPTIEEYIRKRLSI